jgi:hypothetical protein
MTKERAELLAVGHAIVAKLCAAIDGEPSRPAMFALTAFAVSICHQAGVPIEDFIVALRKAEGEKEN